MSLPKSQLGVEWMTDRLGRPWTFLLLLASIAAWIAFNGVSAHNHAHPPDPPPFWWMQTVLSILAFLMTILILATENRQGALDERRAQLTLQISLLSEKKISKLIQLVERIRQEHPLLSDPTEKETGAMMTPANPKQVMRSLDEAQEAAMENEKR